MRAKLFFILFCFFLTNVKSQNWQWAIKAGGIYSDKASDVDVDANGNAYISGYYNVGQPADISVNFGSTSPATNWGKEGFIAKVNKQGQWQWVRTAIGGYDDRVLGIHVDKINGFVYATGTQWGWGSPSNNLSFGNCNDNYPNGKDDQIFVAKFDLNGTCQWLIGAGGDSDDHGFDLTTDKLGNIYLTGFISDKNILGTPAVFQTYSVYAPPGDSLGFVAKISPSGVFQWVKTFGGTDGERDNRIAVDSTNNVYVAGGFYGTKTFGTTTLTSTNGGLDIFVVKYDSNGNFQWVKQAGGILDDRANGITVDQWQKIYITGEFRDKAIFGTDTINNNGGPNGRDIFVAKMNASGAWKWAKKAGSKEGGERGNSICTNKKGNIFITGQFADTAKFGGVTIITTPTVDVFVAAIDSLGTWRWAMKGGGIYEDRGNGIACDDSCNLYTTGYYEGTVTFGTNTLVTYGSKDIFAARLTNACFNYIISEVSETRENYFSGTAFPNPGSELIRIKMNAEISSEKIQYAFTDLLGRKINVPVISEKELTFDVSGLQNGVYVISLSYEGKSAAIKFVKQ
ncbi:MAG: hypothetical protein K0S32_2746 [Bacteroidetes bacterium]|jgi:hypothetical protein|nr:hypothetical protein [Bacteroidota bacterium]